LAPTNNSCRRVDIVLAWDTKTQHQGENRPVGL
jgi:hypothetical protein